MRTANERLWMSTANHIFIGLASISFLAAPAVAGTTYVYRTIHSASLMPSDVSWRVWVEGADARMEGTTAQPPSRILNIVRISTDYGREIFQLNTSNKTFYERNKFQSKQQIAGRAEPPLGNFRYPSATSPSVTEVDVTVKKENEPAELKAPESHKIVVTLSYKLTARIAGQEIPAYVEAKAEFYITDQVNNLAFGHGTVELRTGLEEVDRRMAEELADIKGQWLTRRISAVRSFDGSEPVTETHTTTITEIGDASTLASQFDIPPDYEYKEPVIIGPVRRPIP